MIGSSHRLTATPHRPIGSSSQVIGSSSRLIGSPVHPIGSSSRLIGSSSRLIGSPVHPIGSPAHLTALPIYWLDLAVKRLEKVFTQTDKQCFDRLTETREPVSRSNYYAVHPLMVLQIQEE